MPVSFIKISGSLYWKISALFLLLFILLAIAYIYITSISASNYALETNQRLNAGLAEVILNEFSPFAGEEVDEESIKDIMHHIMVINPSLEVYLLDEHGNILTYAAPHKKIKRKKISLDPVNKFIESKGTLFIKGDDPRDPAKTKIFSAAPVRNENGITGYLYVILASEEYDSVTQFLFGSYIMKVGTYSFLLTLFAALALGLVAIRFITKNLTTISKTVKDFKNGDLNARIRFKSGKGELAELADNFNEMADTILDNIKKIRSMENLRSELIANVSHDLRTPLAVIHGYIETLIIKQNELSAEEKKKHLHTILKSTEKLKNLVAQLFEYSKLESMQIKLNKEPFFITELIQDVSHKYQLLAKEKGIAIKLLAPKEIPLVHADLALIDRVLQNLIDNAIKFTPEGGSITIELNNEKTNVQVSISDTGRGIPDTEIAHIFERYHKARPDDQEVEGAGLGLAIVKKIIDIHNSTIQVKSKINHGTSFIFNLPSYVP
ncbi:MAG: ATP-binding protein [Ignavibacteriaceae bacterium]